MTNSVLLKLPDGRKLRSYSHRRYVAVWLHGTRPTVEKRSDNLGVLRLAHGGRYVWSPAYVIMDTVTGQAIPDTDIQQEDNA